MSEIGQGDEENAVHIKSLLLKVDEYKAKNPAQTTEENGPQRIIDIWRRGRRTFPPVRIGAAFARSLDEAIEFYVRTTKPDPCWGFDDGVWSYQGHTLYEYERDVPSGAPVR